MARPSKIIRIDIDETICHYPDGNRIYENAIPLSNKIAIFNQLYNDGNTIIYWTARGSGRIIDGKELTDEEMDERKCYLKQLSEEQLNKWNVLRHEIIVGKPAFDLLIDDKAMCAYDDFGVEDIYNAIDRNLC
jgi:hypothetical protein